MKHYVVSDFHLNMGRDESGRLHPLEDFDCHDAFDDLLELVQDQGGHLIINGDWVDFLQLEPFPSLGNYRSSDGTPLFYTAETALRKLETCFQRNGRHFASLRAFLTGGGKLSVLQGNHDADWFFPSDDGGEPPLQARLRRELGNPPADRLVFLDTSLRIGSVYIEHGHQCCEHVNAFQDHPHIFHPDRAEALLGKPRLELLWGSRLVVEFFNGLEQNYPFADNLKPTTKALLLGVRNGWVGGRTAADFLRFALGAGTPWGDLAEVLGGEEDPARLVQSLPEPELRSILLERMRSDPEFHDQMKEALDEVPEDEKESWRPHPERALLGPEEVGSADAEILGLIRERREFREARRLLTETGISAVLFGHTHNALDGNSADAPVPNYFNTGTWTPTLDLRDSEVRRRLADGEFPLDLLADRSLFKYRLTYAEITEQPGDYGVELKEM